MFTISLSYHVSIQSRIHAMSQSPMLQIFEEVFKYPKFSKWLNCRADDATSPDVMLTRFPLAGAYSLLCNSAAA